MGTIPGPLNVQYHVPVTAPNMSAVGTGGSAVFTTSGVDTSFTAASAPCPSTLLRRERPLGPRVAAMSSNSSSSRPNDAAGAREGMVGATVLGALLGGVAALLLA
ncbi:hypothetical protein EDB92DRAFT_1944035 [Lactarius akahatsu]|uniref:Uncharacterized protein n=1 Tax=Lactarius akahatsu TaxID=416441 RepID=A0AAD4QC42_9AGAM|nr:hypothetical protein EDB92DRAFT_1944035 [Lactarius akahatsu]